MPSNLTHRKNTGSHGLTIAQGHIVAVKGNGCVARGLPDCRGLPRADRSAQVGHGWSLFRPLQRSSQRQLPMQLPEARKLPDCLPHRLEVSLHAWCAASVDSTEMPFHTTFSSAIYAVPAWHHDVRSSAVTG